jgi:type VI secretion system protein ImpM
MPNDLLAISSSSGFYGKLPSRGDFVKRGLSSEFIQVMDDWIQECMSIQRGRLEAEWLNTYLTSPIWRFCLAPGIIGPESWCGALMPSVDRVNRYFPLLSAIALPKDTNIFDFATSNNQWFEGLDDLLLTALDNDDLDIDEYYEQVIDHGRTHSERVYDISVDQNTPGQILCNLPEGASNFSAMTAMLNSSYASNAEKPSIWFSAPSEGFSSKFIVCNEMPKPEEFVDSLYPPTAPGLEVSG